MAKGMSKKERKLREEIAELEQKKTRGFMQTAGGIIIFVLFLIIRQVLVANGMFNPETVSASVATYAIAVVAAGFVGIGGHRLVGGCRASAYNAVPLEACKALAEFMEEYMKANK